MSTPCYTKATYLFGLTYLLSHFELLIYDSIETKLNSEYRSLLFENTLENGLRES
jgi:hypothetical protein